MVISVRVSDEAGMLMKEYAETNGLTVSQLLRSAVQERLDNENRLVTEGMEVMREPQVYAAKKRRRRKKKTAQI